MAVIALFGKVDKRILAFPLIRALSMTGDTIVITDDGSFKNLYHDNGSSGVVDGVSIMVINELRADFSLDTKDYQNIVYVFADRTTVQADCTIVCHGDDRSLKKESSRLTINKKEDSAINVYLRIRPLKVKERQIILKPEYYRYLIETEEKKELLILRDKKICRLLAGICSEAAKMRETQFYQLLFKKRYETSLK